ncbi:uncharacterized protein SEPMUDRAFT_130740, partial [Sphaerulina musiva SO2202]
MALYELSMCPRHQSLRISGSNNSHVRKRDDDKTYTANDKRRMMDDTGWSLSHWTELFRSRNNYNAYRPPDIALQLGENYHHLHHQRCRGSSSVLSYSAVAVSIFHFSRSSPISFVQLVVLGLCHVLYCLCSHTCCTGIVMNTDLLIHTGPTIIGKGIGVLVIHICCTFIGKGIGVLILPLILAHAFGCIASLSKANGLEQERRISFNISFN